MATLLIVHHTPSPSLHDLLDQVLEGAMADGLEEVEPVPVPALHATASHVLEADGIVLGTPANIGYMSGALKHFLDQVYYPCLGATDGLPYGCYVHGNDDTTGATRAVTSIAGAIGWTEVTSPVQALGPPDDEDRAACRNLGATVAAAAGGLV